VPVDDDIEQLRARNAALARELEGLRRVFEASPVGMAVASSDGVFVDINPSGLDLFGMERAEVIGRTAADIRLIEHETEADRAEINAQLGEHGRVREVRRTMRTKSGAPREVSLHVDPIEIEGTLQFLSTFVDITARCQAEDRLRKSEAQLQEAQEVAQLGSWDWDLRANVITRSAELYRIYGRTEVELRPDDGLTYSMIHPDDHERVRAAMARALAERRPYSLDYRIVRPDGIRFLHTRGQVVCDAAGEPVRTLGTVQDWTERKHVEAQLMIAERMASVGTLAAGVAHEINNPLAYVISSLELGAEQVRAARGGSGSEGLHELAELLGEARQGAERIRKIVGALKTFSRADEERRAPIDVRQALDVAVDIAFTEIRHRARLVKEYRDVPLVEADEARLTQVFINLLVNAAQAIPEGQADRHEIHLSTGRDEAGRAVLAIRDTGAGMSPEVLLRIFDPFFTTKPIGVGSGLGLSICHGIISALDGEITVKSEPGRGTLVLVSLPPASPAAPRPDRALTPTPGRGLALKGRVLIVDDDMLVGKALRRALKDNDVTVLTDAREARSRVLGGERFDLILCDLMMPEMTGMELHAELAREAPEQAERMIFVTGGAFTEAAAAFLERIPNPRLAKPFDIAKLRELARGYLE
jgi:PAS domain S-box-containing protein